jgi:hypothetical protein
MDYAQSVRGVSSIPECQSVFNLVTVDRDPRDDLIVGIVAEFRQFQDGGVLPTTLTCINRHESLYIITPSTNRSSIAVDRTIHTRTIHRCGSIPGRSTRNAAALQCGSA